MRLQRDAKLARQSARVGAARRAFFAAAAASARHRERILRAIALPAAPGLMARNLLVKGLQAV